MGLSALSDPISRGVADPFGPAQRSATSLPPHQNLIFLLGTRKMMSGNSSGAASASASASASAVGGDGRHDDDAALTEFLSSLMDYTPTIPDELVEHYLGRSGFNCPDLRLTRLVAVATQKFISDIASDALQHSKARVAAPIKDNKSKQPKDKRLVLTMEDLSKALREYGVNLKHPEYFADGPFTGTDPPAREE